MRRYAFVAQILALLIGFYLICLGLVAGLIALTVVEVDTVANPKLTVFLVIITLAAIFVVLRGIFVSTRLRAKDIVGIQVTEAEQPALWYRIRQLAQRVGTRAPRRLYLVPDVNAAVWENTRLLGLVPGKRQMMIGVPLLMALTPAQVDAILAHELGHYGNRDTRLGGLVGRTRQSVLAALRAADRRGRFQMPGSGLFVLVFTAYAGVVLRVTQEASRAQEYAADRVAAEIAGPANAIAALSEMDGIDAAFGFYLKRYVGPALGLGLMPPPPEVFGGFAALLAEPARRAELDEMKRMPPAEEADRYDSHPPMAQRIAALAALPQAGTAPDPATGPALAILADPAGTLTRVAARALAKELAGKQPVPWDGLAQAIGLRRADERAAPLQEAVARLTGRPADLRGLVWLVDAGRYGEVLDALPRGEAARQTNARGRVAREHAKTQLVPMLTGWLHGHLARTGQAGWVHSWADIAGELRLAPPLKAEVDAAVEDLVAVRPNGARLQTLVGAAS
jgi:Zn-dependent protease with chaperone function